jgi:hypothetical protein
LISEKYSVYNCPKEGERYKMFNKLLYVGCLSVFLSSCASDGVRVDGNTDEVFVVEDSYTPYEWHRTYHGPDRFFERRDQFIIEP